MSTPATRSKRSRAANEASAVEKTPKAPARRAAPKRAAAPKTAPAPEVAQRRPWFAVVLVALLAVAAAAAVAVFALQADDAPDPAAAVSRDELVALARARETPVYWAGEISGRELELTTTADGTFVRYLPAGVPAGDDRRTLTIATYPVRDAYATATAQAKTEGMTSRETRNGGLAVWSRAQPTSVYVAFAGVPQLIEVYAPNAAEARRLALSGRIRRVR
jgi:hypothetical protein